MQIGTYESHTMRINGTIVTHDPLIQIKPTNHRTTIVEPPRQTKAREREKREVREERENRRD